MIFISPLPPSTGVFLLTENISMDKHSQKKKAKATTSQDEVSSLKWELIKISEQEEDIINRMYRLVPNRWDLIAGRIPGRTPEEIERFWIMSHGENFAQQRK